MTPTLTIVQVTLLSVGVLVQIGDRPRHDRLGSVLLAAGAQGWQQRGDGVGSDGEADAVRGALAT